jgi:hypothetical protein
MAIAGCNCQGKIGNTGYPNVKPFGVTSGVYLMPLFANDGTRNGIDLTSNDFQAQLLGLLYHVDPSKRLYPFTELRNVTHEEADANYETADNGERFKTRDGVKTVSFQKWNVTEQYFQKVADNCVEFGVYLVDVCGNLKGQKEGDFLYPRPVNKNSYDAKYIDATADAGAKVMIQMDYKLITSDGDQWMLPASLFGELSLLEVQGMIDVNFEVVDIVSGTSLVVDAYTDYGFAHEQTPWRSGATANFTLVNATTNSPIVISNAVQNGQVPGRYTLTIASTSASTSVRLSAFKAGTANGQAGFEGKPKTFVYSWT